MALNIKNPEVVRLAVEVAAMAHETKTAAIRRALEERRQRLAIRRVDPGKAERLLRFVPRCGPLSRRNCWDDPPCPGMRRTRFSGTGQVGSVTEAEA